MPHPQMLKFVCLEYPSGHLIFCESVKLMLMLSIFVLHDYYVQGLVAAQEFYIFPLNIDYSVTFYISLCEMGILLKSKK